MPPATGGAIQPEDKKAERDPSEDVADWLKEVGQRRREPGAPESAGALLAYFERVSARPIRTRDDIDAIVHGLARAEKAGRRRVLLKNTFLGVLLIVAILQYYFIDVQLQIFMQPSLTVFVPVKDIATARPQRISEPLGGLPALRETRKGLIAL